MVRSFVLRVRSELLSAGQLVGEIEDVASGQRHVIRHVDDLVDACHQLAAAPAPGVAVVRDVER